MVFAVLGSASRQQSGSESGGGVCGLAVGALGVPGRELVQGPAGLARFVERGIQWAADGCGGEAKGPVLVGGACGEVVVGVEGV